MPKPISIEKAKKLISDFEFNKIIFLIREEIKKELIANGIEADRVKKLKKVYFEIFHDSPGDVCLDGYSFLDENNKHTTIHSLFVGVSQNKNSTLKLDDFINKVANAGIQANSIPDTGLYYNFSITEEPQAPVLFIEE